MNKTKFVMYRGGWELNSDEGIREYLERNNISFSYIGFETGAVASDEVTQEDLAQMKLTWEDFQYHITLL